ncbi:hypothetical protein ACWGH5_17410 [Streptomyces sp. NPDC054864]
MTKSTPTPYSWDDFDRLLGAAVREAAMLELFLGGVAQTLSGSRYGAVLITGESSERIIRACKVLIDMHTDIPVEKRTAFKDLLAQSGELFQARHRYVHGTALPGVGGGVTSIRPRRLKLTESGPIDLAALAELSDDLKRLSDAVAAWNYEVHPDTRWS